MSTKKLNNRKPVGWDDAIQAARREIEKLEISIKVFEKSKAAGESWPGAQLSNHGNTNEQHAI